MKITLLTVGKTDVKWVREGLDLYMSRLAHYIPFQIKEIPELKNVSALSRDQIKSREGGLILKALRPQAGSCAQRSSPPGWTSGYPAVRET